MKIQSKADDIEQKYIYAPNLQTNYLKNNLYFFKLPNTYTELYKIISDSKCIVCGDYY